MKFLKPGPLNGITVVDLTRVMAGPYCTLMLAELGARVIKVEKPEGGDDARSSGPFLKGRPVSFSSVNRNKESVALDLTRDIDRGTFEQMLEHADVLTENFRPGVLARLGYDWDLLHRKYPKLIYAAVSGYGHTGPSSHLPGYDMVMQGMAGMMSVTGEPDGGPVRVGISIGDIGSGLFAATAINAALVHRERTGETTKIDIAMFDCMLALMEAPITRYLAMGEVSERLGSKHVGFAPFEAFPTADRYITLSCANDKTYQALCRALERPDLATDPAYFSNLARVANRDRLHETIAAELKKRAAIHWLAHFEANGVPVAMVNDIRQAMEHPQVAARNMVVESEDPVLGHVRMLGTPFKFSAFQEVDVRRVGPNLDQDREAVFADLGILNRT